jgi:hypothetical protein
MGTPWTALERERVRQLRAEGKPWKAVARLLGRSRRSVRALAHRSGFCPPRRPREEIDRLVRDCWRGGLSPHQTRVRTGCPVSTVLRSLARQSLAPREADLRERTRSWRQSTSLPSLAAARNLKARLAAAREGFRGCRSTAELEVCRLLRSGSLSARQIAASRGRRYARHCSTHDLLARLVSVGLVVKAGTFGPGVRWALARSRGVAPC